MLIPAAASLTRPRCAAAHGLRPRQRRSAGRPPGGRGLLRPGRGGPRSLRTADVPAGTLGYRVRVGDYATKAEADAGSGAAGRGRRDARTASTPAGTATRRTADRGTSRSLRIDPKTFTGRLAASFGPDLHDRETTSALADGRDATAGVNGGFFVLDPASGAPGDPAGAGVYDGRVLSESSGGSSGAGAARQRPRQRRAAAVLGRRGRHRRPEDAARRHRPGSRAWSATAVATATDPPTALPLHDVTCTDDSELVAFTPAVRPGDPVGGGARGRPRGTASSPAVHDGRGTTLAPGQTSIQATGGDVALLADVEVGDRLPVRARLEAGGTAARHPARHDASPTAVRSWCATAGCDISQRRDGFVHPGDPSFAYGWFVKRNPRTIAGVDGQGRTVLVTVGRPEHRRTSACPSPRRHGVARSLGLVDAINLDGGGSTTMVVHGSVDQPPLGRHRQSGPSARPW